MWNAKVIKAEDVFLEDRIGQHPVKTLFARIVRQSLSGGLDLTSISSRSSEHRVISGPPTQLAYTSAFRRILL